MNHILRAIFLTFSLTVSFVADAAETEEVNIFSARKEQLIKPILDEFTTATGIKVNLITGDADVLLKRLESEGKNSAADLLITTDVGRLHRAKQAGVLQAVDSKIIKEIVPANLRDSDDQWFGLSLRARPLWFVKGKLDPKSLSTYEDLADPEWKKKICIRSSDHVYNQSLVASMIAANGKEATLEWAKKFVNNFAIPPRGGDRDQIKSAVAGVCDIAIANSYYIGQMFETEEEKEAASKVQVFWPNQNNRGAHINVSGAAVLALAKNKNNAIKLIEFLLSEKAQRWYADVNYEYPVRPGVELSVLLKSWGEFKSDNVNMSKLGELNQDAVKIMDLAGWK